MVSNLQVHALYLSKPQLEKLDSILESATDEGPLHEGWCSSELCTLRSLVADTLMGVMGELGEMGGWKNELEMASAENKGRG